MIDCMLEMKVDIAHFDLQALNAPPSILQVYSRMPQVANQSHTEAAQLFCAVPIGTVPSRKPRYRTHSLPGVPGGGPFAKLMFKAGQ